MADKDFDYGLPTPGVLGEDPELHNRLVWYGVLHENGSLTVKRYFSWLDYKEAGDSDFTLWTTRLFEAENSTVALRKASGMVTAKFPGRYLLYEKWFEEG